MTTTTKTTKTDLPLIPMSTANWLTLGKLYNMDAYKSLVIQRKLKG